MQKYKFACYLVCCKTRFPTFTEEHRLRKFEKMGLRAVFGPRGDEVTGVYRRL